MWFDLHVLAAKNGVGANRHPALRPDRPAGQREFDHDLVAALRLQTRNLGALRVHAVVVFTNCRRPDPEVDSAPVPALGSRLDVSKPP